MARSIARAPIMLCMLAVAPWLGGCPSVHTEPFGNGEQRELTLDYARRDPSLPPARETCADGRCWMLSLEVGRHELAVTRQVKIYDCGGFGDCLTDVDVRELEGTPRFDVVPRDAATIDGVAVFDDILRFELEVPVPTDFALVIEIGEWADDWSMRANATCEPFDCAVYEDDASDAPACCGYAGDE